MVLHNRSLVLENTLTISILQKTTWISNIPKIGKEKNVGVLCRFWGRGREFTQQDCSVRGRGGGRLGSLTGTSRLLMKPGMKCFSGEEERFWVSTGMKRPRSRSGKKCILLAEEEWFWVSTRQHLNKSGMTLCWEKRTCFVICSDLYISISVIYISTHCTGMTECF